MCVLHFCWPGKNVPKSVCSISQYSILCMQVIVLIFPLSQFYSPFQNFFTQTVCLLILFSALHQSCANEKLRAMFVFVTHWIFVFSFPTLFVQVLIHSSFKPALKYFLFFFSKDCANTGVGIIHMTSGMHLAVTLPQAVNHPPSYLCHPESFLRMHLESETPCQLFASAFLCSFFCM